MKMIKILFAKKCVLFLLPFQILVCSCSESAERKTLEIDYNNDINGKHRLIINSEPEAAKLYLEGQYYGLTPIQVMCSLGDQIRIEKEGFESIDSEINKQDLENGTTFYMLE